jgi:hypothetical protein
MFYAPSAIAYNAAQLPTTPREIQLNKILEASGQDNDSLLLSERFRQNSSLRRQYLEIFSLPDWISKFSLSTHFEASGRQSTAFAGSIDSESLIQLGNNFELAGRWSTIYTTEGISILRKSPKLAPTLEHMTLSYGSMRTVELNAGLLSEHALLSSRPIAGQFSGLAATIHPLKDKMTPHQTRVSFQIEHGWSAPTTQAGTRVKLNSIQRTRPSITVLSKAERISLQGRASLEWYTDPERALGLMSATRAKGYAGTSESFDNQWRLFVVESALELRPLRETGVKFSGNRINNSLATELETSWSSSLLITQNYRFSKGQGTIEISTTAFNTQKFGTPTFRLPIEMSPASRGVITELSASIHPITLKNHQFKVSLSSLMERPHSPQSRDHHCQLTNITISNSCELFFGQLSLVRTLGPNL